MTSATEHRRTPRAGAASRVALFAALAATVLASAPARADIWRFVDRNGVVHFSDHPLGPGYRLFMRSRHHARPTPPPHVIPPARLVPIIDAVSNRFRIDPALVHAVITTESAYDANAVSPKGAVGLMQLMPGTARRYGVHDRNNPVQNITAGVCYLRYLLLRYRNVPLALAAYNAGEDAVARFGNRVPPYPETVQYIRRVITRWRQFRSIP